MVGIVLGLFNMADLGGVLTPGAEDLMGQSISILLGGVKWAMVASFTGLLLTVINSSISIPTFSDSFKDAKVNIEGNKNDFYTFIQTELLPKINVSLSGTFEALQRNLSQFNNDFTANLGKLNTVFKHNQESVELQYKTFEKLDKLDIANIAKYNVTTLKQLETSLQQFDKFNLNVANLNNIMISSENVVVQLNELLERTGNFGTIAENLDLRLTESQNLLTFLTSHMSTLNDYRKDINTTAVNVSFEIKDVFSELKEHIQDSTNDMKSFTIQEVDIFKQAMQESRTNLSNLEFLKSMNTELGSFSKNSNKSNADLVSEIVEMKKRMADVYYKLKDIEEQSILYKATSLIGVKKANK
jgi:gas vesicle protein